MATEALALDGVDALYGDSHVLHSVSFSLQEGHVLALLGRNGAGKTTCMNAVIGFLPPREGEIRLFGERIGRLSPEAIARKGVGLVPQGRRVFPTLTVKENLLVAARGKNQFDHIFELFPRLKERTEQHAGSLSGGEQQMLAIARALMTNPALLLLDEPLEGLAPIIVEELVRALRNIEDTAMILVEQHAEIALSLTEQAIVIERGRVAHAGASTELMANAALLERYVGVTTLEAGR